MGRAVKMGTWFEAWLDTRLGSVVLLALVAGLYTWAYQHHPLNPGSVAVAQRAGWWSWSDQYKYLQSAEALAAGKIAPDTYHYPLGYPALGAPFVRWLPVHPFFVPDLLLVLATAACWWRLVRRWLPATAALLVAIVFLDTHRDLIELTMVVPWNTLVTQFCLVAGVSVVLAPPGRRVVWWLAALAALAWWVRPVDALCLAPLLVCAMLRLPTWTDRLRVGAIGV